MFDWTDVLLKVLVGVVAFLAVAIISSAIYSYAVNNGNEISEGVIVDKHYTAADT